MDDHTIGVRERRMLQLRDHLLSARKLMKAEADDIQSESYHGPAQHESALSSIRNLGRSETCLQLVLTELFPHALQYAVLWDALDARMKGADQTEPESTGSRRTGGLTEEEL